MVKARCGFDRVNFYRSRFSQRFFVCCLMLIFLFSLSLSTSASVRYYNVSINDTDRGTVVPLFNLSSGAAGLKGHVRLDNTSPTRGAYLEVNNTNASLLFFGFFSSDTQGQDFRDKISFVPNVTFKDFQGKGYGTSTIANIAIGDMVGFTIINSTGHRSYGTVFVKNMSVGSYITLEYKYNTDANNNTFLSNPGGCFAHTEFESCLNDTANKCHWEQGVCDSFGGSIEDDLPPAECGILPQRACDTLHNGTCKWNSNLSTSGLCTPGINFSQTYGFNCSAILNVTINGETFCNNQPFTERTGLCTWNGATENCTINKTKRISDLPAPPVFSCEAQGYVENYTRCINLSLDYSMPCGWNNATSRCEDLFFDDSKIKNFEDIGDENTCKLQGGRWVSDFVYDPVTGKISNGGWCEHSQASACKLFTDIGAGGSDFKGVSGQFNDCNRDCFGCEFQTDGSRWSDSATASAQCGNSKAGCTFQSDTNAFNGQGWCNPSQGFGGFDCDSFCGDCNLNFNPRSSCQNSSKSCRWDNVTNACTEAGLKNCNQNCMQCQTQNSCTTSQASAGNCIWDTGAALCKPSGGSFEICFDGIDNDQDGKTDCNDFKCSSDPFCGGVTVPGASCFKHLNTVDCAADTSCKWGADHFGFQSCSPLFEQCFTNNSMNGNKTACDIYGGGTVCTFLDETHCSINESMADTCVNFTTANSCNNGYGCLWDSNRNFCEFEHFARCENNATLQNNQTQCISYGCAWIGGSFGGGFEGFGQSNCVSPCQNSSVTSQATCGTAPTQLSGSAGSCVWQTGFCEPQNFIGGCWRNDGDISACKANSACSWFPDPQFGHLKNLTGNTSFGYELHPGVSWMAIGLTIPNQTEPGVENVSVYNLTRTSDKSFITLVMAYNRSNNLGYTPNISELYCNSTLVFQYNYSNMSCGTHGSSNGCIGYNFTTCNGANLHYNFNITTNATEVLWEVDVNSLLLDTVALNINVTNTANFSTVLIDGNLSEHIPERASANDGSMAYRVRTQPGFCDDGLQNSFFKSMEDSPPEPIAGDTLNQADDPAYSFLDFSGLGVKKTPEAYMYGMPTENLNGSMLCNGVPLNRGGGLGTGANTTKYYLYLDTDGTATGGCTAVNNASIVGFEYLFKYVAQKDATTGKLSETTISQKCSGGSWVASNVPFKTDKKKSCNFIGGPIFGIDKDILTSKSDVSTSASWRTYATSAALGGNASNVSDTVGPGKGDFRGIDVEIVDCLDPAFKGNSQCTKFKQFGFFPGEFGPACGDNKDNDGDGDTDCADFDCIYDPFFCSGSAGSFAVQANDDDAPNFVSQKVNTKVPTSLALIFGTNEPSNATVRFYHNDSTCTTLNATFNDRALDDGNSLTTFRPHHSARISGLVANTTYFYKLLSCDPSGNCALSKCSNKTTASKFTNVTFKLDIPDGWSIDIPQINLSNYSKSYALKASTQNSQNMTFVINSPDNSTAITLEGVAVFEKQTLNISRFVTGAGFAGMDANQYQNFKQKVGLENSKIKIAGTGGVVQHCDDDGANCQTVTSSLNCVFGEDDTTCDIPDAVGLGYSSYKATAASSSGPTGGSGAGSSAITTPATIVGDTSIDSDVMDGTDNSINLEAPTESKKPEPVQLKVKQGGKISFSVKTSSVSAAESHSVTVDKVSEDSATLTVASSPKTVEIKVKESQEVDMDDDDENDLKITLNAVDVDENYADFSLTLLTSGVEGEAPVVKETKEEITITEEETAYLLPILLGIVAAVIGGILVVVILGRRRKAQNFGFF